MAAGDTVLDFEITCRKTQKSCDTFIGESVKDHWTAHLSGNVPSGTFADNTLAVIVTSYGVSSSGSELPFNLRCDGGPRYRLTITEV